jgi:tetratricopeptide (TPR) repeat protein
VTESLNYRYLNIILSIVLFSAHCFSQSVSEDEKRKDTEFKKAQAFLQEGNYEKALKCYFEVADICEKYGWTGAGHSYEKAALCYAKTERLYAALKTYNKAKMTYEREGLDFEATRIKRILHTLNNDFQRNIRRDIGNWYSWIWFSFMKYSSDYGTDPIVLFRNMLVIVLFFAFVFYPYSPNKVDRAIKFRDFTPEPGIKGTFYNFKEVLFISALIFLGRNHPPAENGRTRFLVVLEALLGYLILAIFVAMLVSEILQ